MISEGRPATQSFRSMSTRKASSWTCSQGRTADDLVEARMIPERGPQELHESAGDNADDGSAVSDAERQAGEPFEDTYAGPSAAGDEGADSDADKDASDKTKRGWI